MRISVILLILLLLVGNVGNAVSVDSSKGKKILANAYQDFAALDQYHLDVIITSLIPYQNICYILLLITAAICKQSQC